MFDIKNRKVSSRVCGRPNIDCCLLESVSAIMCSYLVEHDGAILLIQFGS